MQSGGRKKIDVARLNADLAAAGVEILSAHCAADHVRLQYSPEDIVAHGEPSTLKNAIASSHALHRFFTMLEIQLKPAQDSGARGSAIPPAWRRCYFSTRMNSPVDASTDTVSFELSRFAPKMTCQIS